jgi:hypothetical protein
VVSMKLTVTQAVDGRDTLSKSLYSNLFDWVIQRVNMTLKTEHSPFSIGILDIFGFEVFEVSVCDVAQSNWVLLCDFLSLETVKFIRTVVH